MKHLRLMSVIVLLACLIVICLPVIVQAESGNAANTWYTSKDEIISFQIVSVDTSAYPKVSITMKYKTDTGDTGKGTWTYDATSAVSQYVSAHPAYKNRRVKIEAEIVNVTASRDGIQYGVKLKMTVGGEITDYANFGLNLWEEFPNDFIDYDAFVIANAIDLYKSVGGLYTPSSLKLNGDVNVVYDDKDSNIVYYGIPLSAMNRVGGYVNSHITVIYNSTTTMMDIIDTWEFKYVYRQGATAKKDLFSESSLFYSVLYYPDTSIWDSTVQKAIDQ